MLCELLLKQAFLSAPLFPLWYTSMHICDDRLTFSLADLFCGLKKMFASQCLKHGACGLLLISGCQCIDGRLYCLILCSVCSTTARKLGRSVYVIHAEKSSSAEEKSVIKQQRWEKFPQVLHSAAYVNKHFSDIKERKKERKISVKMIAPLYISIFHTF